MKSITVKPQQAQSERERVVLKVMVKKKFSWPFQILREVKKSAKTQNQRTKNEKGKKEQKCTHTYTHTQMLSSTSCWGLGQCCGECPDSAASSGEGWKMESRLGLGERGVKVPGEQYQLQGGRGRKWTLLLILKNQKFDKAISLLIASSSYWHPPHIWARGQHGWLFIQQASVAGAKKAGLPAWSFWWNRLTKYYKFCSKMVAPSHHTAT